MFENFFFDFILRLILRLENAKAGRHSTNHVQDAPRISLFLDGVGGGGGWCSSLTRKLD